MGYLTFFCLNFIFVIGFLKFIEPVFGLNSTTALLALASVASMQCNGIEGFYHLAVLDLTSFHRDYSS
jgi:hypothetical protein